MAKKIIAKPITEFNFWLENKISGHFTLNAEQLKEKFTAFIKTKEKSWCERYGTGGTLRSFVGDKAGLNSVGNSENNFAEYNAMEDLLHDTLWDYVQGKLD